jgi:hypothetical protein
MILVPKIGNVVGTRKCDDVDVKGQLQGRKEGRGRSKSWRRDKVEQVEEL